MSFVTGPASHTSPAFNTRSSSMSTPPAGNTRSQGLPQIPGLIVARTVQVFQAVVQQPQQATRGIPLPDPAAFARGLGLVSSDESRRGQGNHGTPECYFTGRTLAQDRADGYASE